MEEMGAICGRPAMATVREDYSENGSVWEYINHDRARSYALIAGEKTVLPIQQQSSDPFALVRYSGMAKTPS